MNINTMTYTIDIPDWIPTSDNKLTGSRWTASRRKCADAQMICVYAVKQRIPKAISKRMVEIIITISRNKRGRRPDPANFYKSTLDALVRGGYLKDDSGKWMQHMPTIVQEGDRTSTSILLMDIV